MTKQIKPEPTDILLVVDIQNDFCPGGALAVTDADAAIPVANRLADRFPHVALTQDWHPAGHTSFASSHPGRQPFETIEMPYGPQVLWPDHCVQGTRGAAFHEQIDVHQAEAVIRKGFRKEIDSYSAFFENDHRTTTGLAGYLRDRGIGRVFLAGLALDFCVKWSAEDARRVGFEVYAIEDGCRAIDLEGSLDATYESFREHGVHVIRSADIA